MAQLFVSGMAHFFVVVSGSKIHERVAHFFIDIYTLWASRTAVSTGIARMLLLRVVRQYRERQWGPPEIRRAPRYGVFNGS